MEISTKGHYGVLAMMVLAQKHGDAPISIKEIARQKELSANYLEQLLAPLRRSGLVNSVRGPKGGYYLAKDPDTITVRDVLEVLEGPLVPVKCTADDYRQSCGCEDECALHNVWVKLQDSMISVVESVTLRELITDDGNSIS